MGLLGLLETQLGVFHASASQSERIVQYRACLKRCDSPARFYHRSFLADEFGTAATLLGWRDRWHLHGWDGAALPKTGGRLSDLAEVEQQAKDLVSPSVGERLGVVAAALERRRTGIERLILVDRLDALPKRWRDVLAKLPVDVAPEATQPAGAGFLQELQSALLPSLTGGRPRKFKWQDDGSVIVARAETRLMAGEWLARLLKSPAHETMLVAERHGLLLDELLQGADRPRQGFSELSAFRPTLQVLPLALALAWDPLDIAALLQFLTHPVCPLWPYARRRIAEKMAASPGLGGKHWKALLQDVAEHYGERADSARKQVAFWLEHERFDRAKGAPLTALISRAAGLRAFFRDRLADDDPAQRAAYTAGHAQVLAVISALEALVAQGDECIGPRQLEQLLAQATARGSENPLLEACVGAGLVADEPAAVIEPVDTVVWWQMEAPALPSSYPWSQAEIAALAKVGVELPPVEDELDRSARAWLRPVLAARKHLFIVLPPESDEVHPLWLMLETLGKGSAPPLRRLECLLTDKKADPALEAIEHRPLPAPRRWWQLPKSVKIAPRDQESYSSLNLCLNNPYQWVLQYPARLRTSTILTAPDNFTLFGNLAHGIVERWYEQPDALRQSSEHLRSWFDETFARVIEQEGATLLLPGKRAYLEGFRRQLRDSLVQLHHHLRKAGVSSVQPEAALSGKFDGGSLTGSADLLVQGPDGRPAVVDMKWSGARKYWQALSTGQFLQLVVYSECVRQQSGSWPRIAYYILDRARLLTPDDGLFVEAQLVRGKHVPTTPELWQQFLVTWRWRQVQLKDGLVEVVLEDIEETDESLPPETGLPVVTLGTAYNPFLNVAGWGADR